MNILDGKSTSKKILSQLKTQVEKLNIKPCLNVIMIGDNPASKIYVRNKALACKKIGISYQEINFKNSVSEKELLAKIKEINADNSVHGLIVQLPAPPHIKVNNILNTIDPQKDVDGFTPLNLGKMFSGESEDLVPATPGGIIRLLEEYNIDVTGMNVVVIGRSNIVGKPIASLLINRSATVSICHSKTKNLADYTKKADLIIAAVGIPKFLKKELIKKDIIIVDVGINKDNQGKLCGDCDFEDIKDFCKYLTPVPGGVGPMTIAQLMTNVVHAAQFYNKY